MDKATTYLILMIDRRPIRYRAMVLTAVPVELSDAREPPLTRDGTDWC